MQNPVPASRLLATLFDAPTLYLRGVDWGRREAHFLRMSRHTYARSSFLDRRTLSVDGHRYSVPLGAVLEQFRIRAPAPRRLNVIFHTAFCGSTLLSRCLDRPGVCLAYKEPAMLHQLSCIKRFRAGGETTAPLARYLDLVLALLSRTYSASEIPLIKPSDTCINLAPDLLARHPASAGLLLYGRLDAFLVSMLKAPRRRRYVRGMIGRARRDLEGYAPLAGVDATTLSDARAAGYVWAGLMVPYLKLLADDRLRLRSLASSVFFAHPAPTLEAVARLFGLALTQADIQAALGGVFTQNAKDPHRAFDRAAYQAARAQSTTRLADEIREGLDWVAERTQDRPIPQVLPRPLLSAQEHDGMLRRS